MPAAARPPTLHDVARRAGVHPATVSRALNHPEMVAEATREAVLDAVAAVDFVPNRSARQLVNGRTGAIGVSVPDITNPYFATFVQAIGTAARQERMAVLVADTGADPAEERRSLTTLARQVDGLVAVTPTTALADLPVPVVQVNRRSRGVVSVVVDQAAIVESGLSHLVGLGHRSIAVLRGPAAYWSATRRDRALSEMAGTDDASAARFDGVELEALGPAPATFEGGRAALEAVVRTGATAVLAFNDLQAAGLLAAAHQAGLAVPGALSVVGSDGSVVASMTAPALTTVAAPLDELASTAHRLLNALVAGDQVASHTTLLPELVARASSAAPPVRLARGSVSRDPRAERSSIPPPGPSMAARSSTAESSAVGIGAAESSAVGIGAAESSAVGIGAAESDAVGIGKGQESERRWM